MRCGCALHRCGKVLFASRSMLVGRRKGRVTTLPSCTVPKPSSPAHFRVVRNDLHISLTPFAGFPDLQHTWLLRSNRLVVISVNLPHLVLSLWYAGPSPDLSHPLSAPVQTARHCFSGFHVLHPAIPSSHSSNRKENVSWGGVKIYLLFLSSGRTRA